jgi:hypothetical protein
MRTYRDEQQSGPSRPHPYKGSDYDTGVDYYDFKKQPELIREKLEDFKPHDAQEAIQSFYSLVEWINVESKVLESNDCAFEAPRPSNSPNASSKKLQASGRLMIFYRELHYNVNEQPISWLRDATEFYIKQVDPTFEDGVIATGLQGSIYEALRNRLGKELVLTFWAFGDTDEETYANLDRAFKGLHEALRRVAEEIIKSTIEQGGAIAEE